jgi:phenylalanyl-tRNA synthetase alpha chain
VCTCADPELCLTLPDDAYVEIVRETHQTGGATGSIGYRYGWSLDEARKNILRTHTTAVSARMLKKIADEVRVALISHPLRALFIYSVFVLAVVVTSPPTALRAVGICPSLRRL